MRHAGAAGRRRDGVADADDACPELAEPRDGSDDDDGCPDSTCTGGDACFTEGAAAVRRGDNAHAYGAFRRGCDAGHGLSCSGLGDLYNSGKVIRVSFERAAALYRKACGLSNAHGCNNLGWALERGLGIDQDIAGAEAQYVRACTLMPGSPACENADIMKARREGRER